MSRYVRPCKTIHIRLLVLLAGMLVLTASGRSAAETAFISELEEFGTTPRYFEEFIILPTSMMDDEALFLAAQTQRENQMPAGQRLINNYWLLANHNNDYGSTGGAALGRLLRQGLISYWKQHHRSTGNPIFAIREQSDISLFGNYKIRVSSDRIVLAYEYRF